MRMGKTACKKAPSCFKTVSSIQNFTRNFSKAVPRRPHYVSSNGSPAYAGSQRSTAGGSMTPTSAFASISGTQKQQKKLDRDILVSILETKVTKRDAKSYMNRFIPLLERKGATSFKQRAEQARNNGNGQNQGDNIVVENSGGDSPKKNVETVTDEDLALQEPFYVALVKFRGSHLTDDSTLNGVGKTISQLRKLGLSSIVVVDCDDGSKDDSSQRKAAIAQANRIAMAIDSYGSRGARVIDSPISIGNSAGAPVSPFTSQSLFVSNPQCLMAALQDDETPIIPSFGYTADTSFAKPVDADEAVLAIIRQLSGLQFLGHDVPQDSRTMKLLKSAEVYRLIILDPLGGTPAYNRATERHIFLNMEQEFEEVKDELARASTTSTAGTGAEISKDNAQHLRNMELAKNALSLLPPTSSAIITTPQEAARERGAAEMDWALVSTRRGQNPLIHNLLTDKPVQSSSLPTERFKTVKSLTTGAPQVGSLTTLAKRGMPLTMYPDPRVAPWRPPQPGERGLSLTDPCIDLPRLVHLIEDSFGRPLDVDHYLKRIQGNLAGVIIAGEYEGGALLTWERPAGAEAGVGAEDPGRLVPYLDKFAVLRRSQGAGGVADIVFNAMVRSCLPRGVCWRSRKDNPVNKWYFERSRGAVKLPGINWTMFWTTPGLGLDERRFRDYESVCRGVEPSWADNKQLLD